MQPTNQAPPRRWRTVKRATCLGLTLVACLGLFLGYRYLSDPQRIRRLAENYLQHLTQRRVSVGPVSFSFTDGINLRDVVVWNAPADAAHMPTNPEAVFSCNEISILQDSWGLLQGKLHIRNFAAIQPTLTLIHDKEKGWEDVTSMVRSILSRKGDKEVTPPIELRLARIKVIHRSDASDELVQDFLLTIRGRKASDNPDLFNIVWQDAHDPNSNGHTQVDLTTGTIRNMRGGLPPMSIRAVMLAVDAGVEGAQTITDLFGIEGRVRASDYNLSPRALGEGIRSATIDLNDASIAIPVSDEEREMPPEDRYLRFTRVQGAVTITSSSVNVRFSGSFHASPCEVNAMIAGPLKAGMTVEDIAVDARLSAEALTLPSRAFPSHRRFMDRWPGLARFFDDYDPHGKVDIELQVQKAQGTSEKFNIRQALVTARGGDASFRKFPYRGKELSGRIEYGPEGLVVRELCGQHDGASVCVNGWMEEPRRWARAEFQVKGTGVNIDEELLAPLTPHQRELIQTWHLHGKFDGTVSLIRDRSASKETSAPWTRKLEFSYDDLSATVGEWPLKVTGISGVASVEEDRLSITHASGRALGGTVQTSGFVEFQTDQLMRAWVDVQAQDVHVDAGTWNLLPQSVARPLVDSQATGCASLEARLTFDSVSHWDYEASVQFRNVEAVPDLAPLPISRGMVDLTANREKIDITRARGYYQEAQLFAKGTIPLNRVEPVNLIVEARRLPLDETVRSILPNAARDVMANWTIDKPLDADLRIRGPGQALHWEGRVELSDATVQHDWGPVPFRSLSAVVHFDQDGIRTKQAQAQYGPARIEFDFDAAAENSLSRGHARLSASGLALDDSLRALLPPGGQRVWDELRPTGFVDLVLDDLAFFKPDVQERATWSVRGRAYPRAVRIAAERAYLDHATIQLEGMLADRLGGMTLGGTVQDADLTAYGQPIRAARASWYLARTQNGSGRAAIQDLLGSLHGGTINSHAQLQFDRQQAQYRVGGSIQGVQLAPWLESWKDKTPGDNQSASSSRSLSEVRGTMEAQLHLAGICKKPETRTGGGRVDIRDGYIYKLPIFMAILNVLNINIPSNDVLSEAQGRFYITGNSVRLSDIAVTGESLTLMGGGTMSLGDHSVDLTLMNAGAGRLAGVPVLAELWEGASRELVEIRVTGPVSQPQVRASPFRGVTEEFRKLFQKKKPRPVQAASP